MGLEFVYQTTYESTIDTLALRDNVKKILQNAAIKKTAASDTYHPSIVAQTLNNTDIYTQNITPNNELSETLNFLKSEAALQLLTLTKRTPETGVDEYADILELKIDESKKNIFAA